jgi:hypothetical protein
MEWVLDGNFIRFALVAVIPLLYCVSLVRISIFILDALWLTTAFYFDDQFFALQIVQNVSMMYVQVLFFVHELV